MDADNFSCSLREFFNRRIYWLFLAVSGVCLMLEAAFSQEINAYKTIASGDFPDIGIWVAWNGSTWDPAVVKPGMTNDIYIDQTHTLRLIGNEQVKSVFINAESGAGEKLNLNDFNLDVYGTLQAFSGAAPGIPDNAWNSQNWIGNSISSTLTFKGTSRTLIQKNSWSAQTTQSRFSVIFEPDAGETLILEAPFKSLSFTVRSGNLLQKIDTSVLPNICFTLSFNTETSVFGTGSFGSVVIEPGATFISECNSNISNRSTSGFISALNFDLQTGGTLILEGNDPRIEAANFQLNGKIIHRGGSVIKNFLSSSYADASTPQSIRDLELQGTQNLNLPNQLFLLGNLEKSGTGNFITTNTSLTLMGSSDQEILGFSLVIRDLVLNKSGGNFFPNGNLTIQRNLTLSQGSMDLEGNDLLLNTGLAGTLSYSGGSWKNIGQLSYFGLPANLDGINSTFPFEDTRNGGIRKIQLLGNSPGGNISISFTEYKGAEYNSGFDDVDGIEILYRLFSYFQFSNLTPSSNSLELRISADDLIVDNVDDLRIVGTGYAAPGTHLPGLDPVELWARRELTFADLLGKNFTIGSYRTLSVLPLIWLEVNSKATDKGNLVSWKVVQAKENLHFEVYRSKTALSEWEKVGTVKSRGNSDSTQDYDFLDISADRFSDYYYRIRQVDWDGMASWSEVTKVTNQMSSSESRLVIYPNPYVNGKLRLFIPNFVEGSYAKLSIQDSQGKLVVPSIDYEEDGFTQVVQTLSPGLYFVQVRYDHRLYTGKLIRK